MGRLTRAETVPHGVFQGRNFMTPNWLGYYRVRGGYAELAYGTGMSGNAIWGVTVRNSRGEDLLGEDGKKVSRCCFSLKEAEELIESLS